jgi:CRISPR-associated protein Cmr3
MTNPSTNVLPAQLKHIIAISPLGMLYGSAGPFLSPANLVGRSGDRFPPSSTTVAGLYGATQWQGIDSLNDLYIVGPFWARKMPEEPFSEPNQLDFSSDAPMPKSALHLHAIQNFYVPTPLNFRVKYDIDSEGYQIVERWQWNEDEGWHLPSKTKEKKAASNTWVSIKHWSQLQDFPAEINDQSPTIPVATTKDIWKYHPHLHPRLEEDQRRVPPPSKETPESDMPAQPGSLFLENGVQLNPDYCLIYLSSRELEKGWYRFGGEGHLAEVECHEITDSNLQNLLSQPVGQCFSLLTPAVWGTQRLSYRFPVPSGQQTLHPIPTHIQSAQETPISSFWNLKALMTERPVPFRFRLGGEPGKTKRLSRGRYGVPAGTVYQLAESLGSWQDWQKEWFPEEGYSYKHWGCGFALPL